MDTLRVSTFGRNAAHDLAVKEGIYAAENLEVELNVTNGSKEQIQELIDGVWHVVHTNADNVFWWNEDNGADLLIVIATPGRPGQDLLVRPEIKTYEDLRGKPIAVDAAESGYATPLRMLLQQAGLAHEASGATFVQVGATQQRIDALRDGRAYAAMVGSNQGDALAYIGGRVIDTINRLFTNYAGTGAVRRQWAEDHPDLLVRYIRAHLRGRQRAEGASAAPPSFAWDGLREMAQMRKDAGLLRGAPDPARFASDVYYKQAAAGI